MEEDTSYEANKCFHAITLTTESLGIQFPGAAKKILDDINLKIDQGERVFIEGKNGSGKTTLIRILSGLLQSSEGAFYINDDTFKKSILSNTALKLGTSYTVKLLLKALFWITLFSITQIVPMKI